MIEREIAYLRAIVQLSDHRQVTYYSLEIGSTSRQDGDKLSELVAQAQDIGLSVIEMTEDLCCRTKMPGPVRAWIGNSDFVPNGMARKIILTNVEAILKERGARPTRSAAEIVPQAA